MAVPALKVEIAFGVGPYATDAQIAASALGWVDVTDHVKEVSVNRGRSSDWDDSFVSTATVVLFNNDRKFDPFNVASPYFNQLNPRRQVKITGTVSSTVYPIFRGYVNGFPVSWQNTGKMSTISVECFDVLALVAEDSLKGDLAEIYTKSLSPVNYYRCSDPSGTLTLRDLGSANEPLTHYSAFGRLPVSQLNLGIGLSGTSMNVPFGSYGKTTGANTSTTGDMSISLWSAGSGQASRNLFTIGGSGTDYVAATVGSAYGSIGTYVQLFYGDFITTNYRETKTNGFDSTVPHHFVFTYKKSDGVAKIYVDGVDQTAASGANMSGINLFPTVNVNFGAGVYQEVAVFNRILTGTEITNLYGFGAGNQVETTGLRLGRLLALTDLPAEKYSVHTTSAASISGVPEPSAPVIETLNKAQKTEAGNLFVQSNGVLKTTERAYFTTRTLEATFTDDGTDFGYSGDIDVFYDGDNLRNDIVVKFGGNSFSQSSGLFDPDSITNNGRHTLTVESQCSTATEATALSQFWLRYGIMNPPMISKFEVGLSATTAQWQTLLELELLDRIRFKRTPPLGTPLFRNLLINSISFNLTPKIWKMQISGSARFTTVFNSREAYGVGTSGSSTSTVITDAPEIQNVTAPAYTYDTATFSGQVNAKGTATNVRIQYGTDPTFASYTELTPSPSSVSGSSFTTVSASVSGLTANTTYYFRVKAYNAIATVFGSGGGITTYRLKVVAFTSSGTWTSPTWGGTAMTGCYYAQLIGGGGDSAGYGYGGGGGAGQASQLNVTLASSMVASIGGAQGNTTLTNVSGTANAGGTFVPALFGNPDGGGNGDGTHSGGAGFYSFFAGIYAGGGGAGAGGAGGAYRTVSGNPAGGHGGAAGTTTYWGISYGGGGGGSANYGAGNSIASTYGGGEGFGVRATQPGYAIFAYYGPDGSRSGTGWSEVNY